MRILAMDTSAGACSAALRDDCSVLERVQEMQRGHAEALMPMIVSVMCAAGRQFRDLDLVAVTIGPGAFTGLRVGLAAARGIALAAGLPCFGVTTLEALAEAIDWSLLAGRPALVVLDDRQGGVYAQLYQAGRPLEPASVRSIRVLAERHAGAPIAVAGDVPPALIASLRAAGANIQHIVVPRYPTAGSAAGIASRRWLAGERPSAPPAPLYLQPPTTGPRPVRAAAR